MNSDSTAQRPWTYRYQDLLQRGLQCPVATNGALTLLITMNIGIRKSTHRDLLRLIVVLTVVNTLVQIVTPGARRPPARPRPTSCHSSSDLELSREPAPADRVSAAAGSRSAVPGVQSAGPGDSRRRTRRGRRASGARHRGSRGGRRRDEHSPALSGTGLICGLLNIQSLKPKLLELSDILHRQQIDILGLCETWLKPTTPGRLLVLPGYRLCRADRPDGRGYGGVALAARDGLSVSPLKVTTATVPNSRLECLWTVIKPDTRRQFICGILYRPPRRGVADLEADFADLENQYQRLLIDHPATKILICGDLNCDFLKSISDPAKRILSSFLTDYSLLQSVSMATYSSGSLLDLVISNSSHLVKVCKTRFCHFSPHKLVLARIDIPRFRPPRRVVRSRCLRRVDQAAFNRDLLNANWNQVFSAPSVTVMWDRFLLTFIPIVNQHAPVRTVRIRNARAPAVTCETKELMSRRRGALTTGGHGSAEYRELNRAVRSAIRRDTCDDVRRRIREEGRGGMWKAIRSTVNSGKSDRKIPSATPDQLNEFFVSVGPRVAGEVRDMGQTCDVPCRLPRVGSCGFKLAPLTLSELRAIVYGMNSSAACGEDGVNIHLVRLSFEAVGTVLLHLINSSISLSEVPDSWKHSLVFPIHKSGDPSDSSNFRPISIVPVIAKIVERAVHQQLYSYLSMNHLLSPIQHCFRPRHSTETALITISDHILSANDRGEISLLCLLDLSKCFDVIDHSKLLTKLQLYGIDVSWFSAYLQNHTQSVSFTDNLGITKKSTSLPNSIGVFQGSALGPLLFCIYANDLSLFAEGAVVVQYADDTQILISGTKSEFGTVVAKMEQTLASLDSWFCASGLKVNAGKTQLMLLGSAPNLRQVPSFSVKFRDHLLSPVPEAKNLGLVFDRTLSWDKHVTAVTRHCVGTLAGLSHLRSYLPTSVVSALVSALVLSQVRYCISVYGSGTKKNMSRIQKIINYAAKVIFGRKKFDHVSDLLQKLGWLGAGDLVRYHSLSLAHKVHRLGEPEALASGLVRVSDTRERHTRQDGCLCVPRSRTEMGRRRFSSRAPQQYNELPPELTELPVNVFTRHLRRHLCGNPG